MWHAKDIKTIVQELNTDIDLGLMPKEAERRARVFGKNILPSRRKEHWWNFLLQQFKSPLIYILIIAGSVTAWIAISQGSEGESALFSRWVDTIVIFLAITINTAVGFWQEYSSNNILEKLTLAVKTTALVIRGGRTREIDAEDLVVGDKIILRQGVKTPADARIVKSAHLRIDESALTGESTPVSKNTVVVSRNIVINDRTNMAYMGTLVAEGRGEAIVVGIGSETEFGKIAELTVSSFNDATPLQVRMAKLGRTLAIVIGAVSILIFILGIMRDIAVIEMFKTAIAVAVAAIPEGLPAAISIVLAVSAQRIYKEKGVVKRLVSAETLGSVQIICTDKTGTLTEGAMRVEKLSPTGQQKELLQVLALANEAVLEQGEDGRVQIIGEITDKAKMEAFLGSGENLEDLLADFPRESFFEFDAKLKYLASIHKDKTSHGKKYYLAISGAPETILSKCEYLSTENGGRTVLTNKKKNELKDLYEDFANRGFRIIAGAKTYVDKHDTRVDIMDSDARNSMISSGLTFVGFAMIRDPLRQDVREAIAVARRALIRPIMLTGDHLLTAVSVGRELGFKTDSLSIIDGVEIDKLSQQELAKRMERVEVGARISPEQKMRIVMALQKNGMSVAMTGDGVNDAPALKVADIGVALNSGTDVAKATSDIILVNNSFSTIVSAIRQGRIAFDNIRKTTVFLLTGSFSELIIIIVPLIATFFIRESLPIPLTAVQILWTNLVEDSFPNIALAFEPGEKDIMQRPPLEKHASVLDREAKIIIFVVGIFSDILLLALYFWLYFNTSLPFPIVQTFIFAALGFNTFFYIFSIKSLRSPIFSYNIASNKLLIIATFLGIALMLAGIYLPPLQSLLGTSALPKEAWAVIIGMGMVEVLGIEIVKWWFFGKVRKVRS